MPRVILNSDDGGYVGQVDVEPAADGRMPAVLFIDPRTFVLAHLPATAKAACGGRDIYQETVVVRVRPDAVDQGPVT